VCYAAEIRRPGGDRAAGVIGVDWASSRFGKNLSRVKFGSDIRYPPGKLHLLRLSIAR